MRAGERRGEEEGGEGKRKKKGRRNRERERERERGSQISRFPMEFLFPVHEMHCSPGAIMDDPTHGSAVWNVNK